MTNRKRQINIKGMHCKSCAGLIEDKLKTLKGVKKAKVSFAQERAFIRLDSEQTGLSTVIEAIEKLGYKANVGDNANDNLQKEKIIRVRLNNPSVLVVLTGITLVLTLINIRRTDNLEKRLASAADGGAIKSESQTAGTLKEIQPQQPSQQQQPSRIEVSVDDDPSMGPENAPVTIIEFSDFQCPYCAKVNPTIKQILETYGDKVRVVFRDLPILGPQSQKAAQASECADEQGKFWGYHDKLFENQRSLDTENLKQYAKDLGLKAAQFNGCLDSGKMAQEVEKDLKDGQNYGVGGTPAFFINGILVSGAEPYSTFEQIIGQELSKK